MKVQHVAYRGAASVGYADVGESGTKITCCIEITERGRWIATGGCQDNYCYGPFEGRGSTPDEAIAAMLRRADDECRNVIAQAAHDAQLVAEERFGQDWAHVTWAEAMVAHQRRLIGATRRRRRNVLDVVDSEDIESWREAEIARLDRIVQRQRQSTSPLAHVSDAELMAEAIARGLVESD